tara:strand:- start:142 stop:510 length:369 start_codon:yes stop_codon:yes gene_type:complete
MTEEKKKSFVLYEDKAIEQIAEARELNKNALNMMKSFLCDESPLKFKDEAIGSLAEYLTNTKFYADTMENYLFSDNIIKDEKTGRRCVVVSTSDFTLMSTYITVIAACENDLEALGISVRLH